MKRFANRTVLPHLLGLALIMAATGTAQAGWPSIAEPPGTKLAPMGGVMEWNSIPMRVQLFTSRLSVDRLLAFYRDRWSEGFVENEYGPWQQISRKEDEYFITVQVQSDGETGSQGRISIMHLHDRPVSTPGAGVPKLQGSAVFNDLRSEDAGRRNRTTALMNRYSVESNRDFYRRHYVERGWGITMMQDIEGTHVAVYRKGADEVTVAINPLEGGTSVLINEVRAGGFLSW